MRKIIFTCLLGASLLCSCVDGALLSGWDITMTPSEIASNIEIDSNAETSSAETTSAMQEQLNSSQTQFNELESSVALSSAISSVASQLNSVDASSPMISSPLKDQKTIPLGVISHNSYGTFEIVSVTIYYEEKYLDFKLSPTKTSSDIRVIYKFSDFPILIYLSEEEFVCHGYSSNQMTCFFENIEDIKTITWKYKVFDEEVEFTFDIPGL